MADAIAAAGGKGGETTALLPIAMVDGTDRFLHARHRHWTPIAAIFVGDKTVALLPEGRLERHGQTGSPSGEKLFLWSARSAHGTAAKPPALWKYS